MARHSGISTSSVGRIWRAFGLQPHRLETFKLSTDPLFVAKVRDVVGLYLNPPDHALVRCVDEKSQIQALDRTQPLLPMRPGQAERRSHDYKRHGTTSLFAALDIATGRVIGRSYQRHRAVEFRNFLAQVEQAVPADLDIHLVLDNYATHKAPPVKAWLTRHPRYHVHFTPVRRETGKEQVVRVHCDEGVAARIGPEPCADLREDVGEASAGERIGQPLSRVRSVVPDADAVGVAEGETGGGASASTRPIRRGLRPWHVRTLLAREPGGLQVGRTSFGAEGPRREGEEP